MDEQKIDKLIEQAINRVGREKDEQDLGTLRTFLETRELESAKSASACVRMEQSDKTKQIVKELLCDDETVPTVQTKLTPSRIKRLWLSVASIAAFVVIVFSLNIYHDNLRMDEAFRTHYTPLEYDVQLMSRSETSPLSLELTEAMEAYQRQDYSTALQKFNIIPYIDENFLIYKAICLIETDQLPQAISLLEDLVSHGEATEYYQQANWYLALSYLKAHEGEKAKMVIEEMKEFSVYIELDKLLNQ